MSADNNPRQSAAPDKARLFFALWPTPPAAESLVAIARDVAKTHGGRVTRPETVHLTLAFLGEVPLASLPEIKRAAALVAVPAFDITLNRLEFWTRQRLQVARCDCPPQLADLVDQLRRSLAATGLLPARADYPFKPHVTLVRKMPLAGEASGEAAGESEKPPMALPKIDPPVWNCDRFVLARSRLSPAGSGYELVAAFPLGG